MVKTQTQPIAVAAKEVEQFGCPYCGYRSGYSPISAAGTSIVVCGECNRNYAMLAEGLTRSAIGFGDYFPKLVDHPRHGTPSHGRPDKQPEQGGEYFGSRGIGMDYAPGCFVCGGGNSMYNNIAAFVHGKAAGERVVAMFSQGARLDYRESEPDRVQVKIGACVEHRTNLERLHTLTHEKEGIITTDIVSLATNP